MPPKQKGKEPVQNWGNRRLGGRKKAAPMTGPPRPSATPIGHTHRPAPLLTVAAYCWPSQRFHENLDLRNFVFTKLLKQKNLPLQYIITVLEKKSLPEIDPN
jgi:hypothetical protein